MSELAAGEHQASACKVTCQGRVRALTARPKLFVTDAGTQDSCHILDLGDCLLVRKDIIGVCRLSTGFYVSASSRRAGKSVTKAQVQASMHAQCKLCKTL